MRLRTYPTHATAARGAVSAVLLLGAAAGCGYSGGEALFISGLFLRPKIPAEFTLTEGPVAVLVDDFDEHCAWPEAPSVLADQVAGQLQKHHAAKKLVPAIKLRQLRQSRIDFDDLSARRIGELIGAEQVIAIEVRSFHAALEPTEANAAARMTVSVKVLNARETQHRSKVRVWPISPGGKLYQAELSAGQVTRAGGRGGILSALTEALAERIVKSFYRRKMEDFEQP